MKKLEFKVRIAASKQQVWETMLDRDSYRVWTNEAWPNSNFQGQWKEGTDIKFTVEGKGGTQAHVEEIHPYDYISLLHNAVVNPDGTLDTTSDIAKGWVGSTEEYILNDASGDTELVIRIHTTPEWVEMFSDGWPIALGSLKRMCELQYH